MPAPDRRKVLRKALRDLDVLVKDARRRKPLAGYAYRACAVSIQDVDPGSGSESNAWLEIDLPAFRKLAPLLRDLLKAELKAEAKR